MNQRIKFLKYDPTQNLKSFSLTNRSSQLVWCLALALGAVSLQSCQSRNVLNQISANKETQVQYPITKAELPNGLKIIWVEDPSLPWVSLNLLVQSGAIHDGGTGLNHLTSQLLDQGSGQMNASQFARAVEQTGSSVAISAGHDFTSVSLEGLVQHRETFLKLFWDVVTAPRFQQGDFDRKKKEVAAQISRMRDNSGQKVSELFHRQLLPQHPYGRLVMGDEASLNKIRRSDVVRHFQQTFVPNQSVLLVAGRLDPQFKKQVETQFASWKRAGAGNSVTPEKLARIEASKARRVVYTKKGLRQSQVMVGATSIERAHPDFLKLRLASMPLGGGAVSASRLMEILRYDQGLTYGAYAWLDSRKHGSLFSISTSTEPKNTAHMVNEIQRIFSDFSSKGITAREMSAAQAQSLGQFPKAIETSSRFSRQYLSFMGLGMEGEEILRFPSRIQAMTLKEVNEAILKHFKDMQLHIVILGPPELAQDPGLKGFEIVNL